MYTNKLDIWYGVSSSTWYVDIQSDSGGRWDNMPVAQFKTYEEAREFAAEYVNLEVYAKLMKELTK